MLLTRLPLGIATPFDLHVLGTPPALVLSQDQTLHNKLMEPSIWLSNSRFVRNLATETVGDPQTFCAAALFSFQGANVLRLRRYAPSLRMTMIRNAYGASRSTAPGVQRLKTLRSSSIRRRRFKARRLS